MATSKASADAMAIIKAMGLESKIKKPKVKSKPVQVIYKGINTEASCALVIED